MTMTPERLKEVARLWGQSGAITDDYCKQTRAAIVSAVYEGMTPTEIAKATRMPKGWVEECILDEIMGGFPVSLLAPA